MATAIKEMTQEMTRWRFNPTALQRVVGRALTEINNGEQPYFDATNPFVQALSASAVETAAFMEQHETECRRRYPFLAQTQDDLYLHMSDADYINRFATPATGLFTLRFYKTELINAMVPEPDTGYMKLTIPRNTFFEVSGHTFSLQYPVDIRLLSHGGLQITYNNDKLSPLQQLETNSILYDTRLGQDGEYIFFDLLMTQFRVTQRSEPISNSKDLAMTIEVSDAFYHARVFHKNRVTGQWDELATTHADGVYDITNPTAVLKVTEGVLTVKVPQVYVTAGMLSSTIRVDMYETKGQVNLPLMEYAATAYSVTWQALDSNEQGNPFSAALTNMNVAVWSDQHIIGGRNEMPFEELRTNVINNSVGPIRQAITTSQLEAKLRNAGYETVKYIDNVTNRVYLATREMPTPELVRATTAENEGEKLLTAAAASIETLTVDTTTLAQMPAVIDNGKSLTLTPDLIYQIVDGVAQPVSQAEVERLLTLPPDRKALEVSAGDFRYTPFHYVLDMNNNAFEIRPYYLDNPSAVSKVFVKQNDTTLMLVGTSSYGLMRTPNGYALRVQTRSDDTYKMLADGQVFAQLAFIPPGERDRAYLNGVLVGRTSSGERVFDFDLASTYNVNAQDELELSEFTMYSNEPRIVATPLLGTFDLIYATSAVLSSRWTPNEVDEVMGRHLLPTQIAGLNHEQLKLKFGEALDMLWSRARTIASTITYQTWDEDQPAFYQEDVLEFGEDGTRLTIVDGELVYKYLHRKGDPVLDADGQQYYAYRKGDFKRDAGGQLIPSDNARGLQRQIELMLLEGVYWFATDPTTTTYRQTLTQALVQWLVQDLEEFKVDLLDKTRVYFYPKTTSGSINVYVQDDVRKAISAGQAFNVVLSVSKQVFENLNLRGRLEKATISTLSTQLQQPTVSVSAMIEALRKTYGSDVVDVQLSGLGGEVNYPLVTMAEETDRLSIRKRLVALADGKMTVEEDVNVTFVTHNKK